MNKFDIEAKTVCLFYKDENKNILNKNIKYQIPIFQRPYSWEEKEIERFLYSLNSSFEEKESLFLGSILLSEKFEIIDGQQRLTTLLILLHILKYEYNVVFGELNLDFLETHVAKEQDHLNQFIDNNVVNIELNKYSKNADLIKAYLKEIELDSEKIQEFKNHILENIYFVLIETKTDLSKTLKIFDTINTTGMDLNGGDIFKIKMYEYLTKYKGENKNVFEQIDNIYSAISEKNDELGTKYITIQTVLGVYQNIIISRFNLSKALYDYSTDRFFLQLFDTKFKIANYQNNLFLKDIEKVELTLADLHQIIECQYIWHKNDYQTNEDGCAMHFIWWSRYSRFDKLVYLFLYRFKNEPNDWENLFIFIRQLSKLFFIYSVRFQKAVYDISYDLIPQLIDSLIQEPKSFEEILNIVNSKIASRENHNNGWYNLDDFLTENLIDNTKRKNLVCRMSAMLEEDYKSTKSNVTDKLFNQNIDIEHIQSYLDKDKNKRQDIIDDWGVLMNSLGNLMILESEINRSIGNREYSLKLKNDENKMSYSKSKYSIVLNQIENYPSKWTKDDAELRKDSELIKINNYLFS